MSIRTLQNDRERALKEIIEIELAIHNALENGESKIPECLFSDLERIERDKDLLDREIKSRIGLHNSKKVRFVSVIVIVILDSVLRVFERFGR